MNDSSIEIVVDGEPVKIALVNSQEYSTQERANAFFTLGKFCAGRDVMGSRFIHKNTFILPKSREDYFVFTLEGFS